MVTQVHFAGGRLDGQRGGNQEIVRTVHTALGRGLLVLLDSHEKLLEEYLNLAAQLAQYGEGRCLFIYAGLDRRLAIIVTRHQRQGKQHLIFHQREQIGQRLHLEGVHRVVLQLILRQRVAGTKKQQTILHIARPLQGPETALTFQRQTHLDAHIDVELALVVTLIVTVLAVGYGMLVRRAAGWSKPTLECGPVMLDLAAQTVSVNGSNVDLTSYEYKVLEYLMMHAGELVSKADLTEHIYQQDFDRDSNTIEVFIGRVRKKVGPDRIETVRGLGYRLTPLPGESEAA